MRGVIAPLLIALAIVAGFFDLLLNSRNLLWLGLGFLALGFGFARDTHRLVTDAVAAIRGDARAEGQTPKG